MPAEHLPVLSGGNSTYPAYPHMCPQCRARPVCEPHSSVAIVAGALFVDESGDGGSHDQMRGFLAIDWHGAHDRGEGPFRDTNLRTYIAESVKGGQFDILFCSTECLRQFLNQVVTEFEMELPKAEREQKEG